jgi:hypothetical protein
MYHECALKPNDSWSILVIRSAVKDADKEHHDRQYSKASIVNPSSPKFKE